VGLLQIPPGREAVQAIGGLNGSEYSFLKHLLSHYSHLHEAGLDLSDGKGKDNIAVVEGVYGGDDPGQGVLAQLGEFLGVGLIETGVGQDHAQGGGGLPQSAFGGPEDAEEFPDGGPGPGADAPFRDHVRVGVLAGLIPSFFKQ